MDDCYRNFWCLGEKCLEGGKASDYVGRWKSAISKAKKMLTISLFKQKTELVSAV